MTTPWIVTVNPSDIKIAWDDLLDDTLRGRDPIVYYHVMWHNGDGNWIVLTDEATQTVKELSHTHVLPGVEQFSPAKFVYYCVRAKNGVGMGPSSSSLAVYTD